MPLAETHQMSLERNSFEMSKLNCSLTHQFQYPCLLGAVIFVKTFFTCLRNKLLVQQRTSLSLHQKLYELNSKLPQFNKKHVVSAWTQFLQFKVTSSHTLKCVHSHKLNVTSALITAKMRTVPRRV